MCPFTCVLVLTPKLYGLRSRVGVDSLGEGGGARATCDPLWRSWHLQREPPVNARRTSPSSPSTPPAAVLPQDGLAWPTPSFSNSIHQRSPRWGFKPCEQCLYVRVGRCMQERNCFAGRTASELCRIRPNVTSAFWLMFIRLMTWRRTSAFSLGKLINSTSRQVRKTDRLSEWSVWTLDRHLE